MSRGRAARGNRSRGHTPSRSTTQRKTRVTPATTERSRTSKQEPLATPTLEPIRLGFVRGVSPSKWAERWRRASSQPLELVPVGLDEVDEARNTVDVLLERTMPGDTPAGTAPPQPTRHAVRLYEEQLALVVNTEHELASQKTISWEELSLVRLLDHPDHSVGWPAAEPWADPSWMPCNARMTLELVATGTGAALMPQPLAQHLSAKRVHVVLTVVPDEVSPAEGSHIWASWQRERDGDDIQHLIGFMRGRTARSSR